MIKGLVIMVGLITFLCVILVGCEFTESHLVKEQAVTFEQEIAYRQRKEIELEGKLKKANETIAKLERQLECKEDLPDEKNTKQ
tara:strand:- start:64 stop:315 length:252 start_codon:yes stop_codon:yes gene_type:complete